MLALAASGGLVAEIAGGVDLESPDVAGSPAELRDLPGGAHRPAGPDSELTGEVASLRRTPGSAAYLARHDDGRCLAKQADAAGRDLKALPAQPRDELVFVGRQQRGSAAIA